MTDKTAEETLVELRKKNAERQRNFYIKNKEKLNKTRRQIYAKGKELVSRERKSTSAIPAVAEPEPEFVPEVAPKTIRTGKTIKVNLSKQNRKWTQALVFEELAKVITKTSSLKTYQDHYITIVKIVGSDDVIQFLKSPTELIQMLDNAKKPSGEPYSVNSRKAFFELLVLLRDKLGVTVPQKANALLNAKFNEYKIMSDDYNKGTRGTKFGSTLSFADYLAKVETEFGKSSKAYLISKIYDEFTLRDDFALKIVEKLPPPMKDNDKDEGNYLVIPKKGKVLIVIRSYKTSEKYGEIKESPSSELTGLIKDYIKTKNLKVDSYLFGKGTQSDFVSKQNKKMGLSGSITQFRNMKENDLERTLPTAAARAELAEKLKHSPIAQRWYTAGNK